MAKCVYRTNLSLQPVSEPVYCIDAIDMFFRPGMPTVEQCVQLLLAKDEICLGVSERRAIMQGPKVVGYVRIVEESEWPSGTAAHRVADRP